jgi:hypothetical protein
MSALPGGLFIASTPVARKVTLPDGTEHEFYFRELPNTAFERYALQSNSSDEAVAMRASAELVQQAFCTSGGEPVLSMEQAEQLRRPVLVAMLAHVFEINGMTKTKKESDKAEAARKKP